MLLLTHSPIGPRGLKRRFEDSDDSDDWVPEDPSALLFDSPILRRPPRKITFRKKPTSNFVGVIWEKGSGKWIVQRNINGSQIKAGPFEKEKDAAHASDELLRKHGMYHLKFNFPQLKDIAYRREAKRKRSKHACIGIAKSGTGWKASRHFQGKQLNTRAYHTKKEAAHYSDLLWKRLGGDPCQLNTPDVEYEKNYFRKFSEPASPVVVSEDEHSAASVRSSSEEPESEEKKPGRSIEVAPKLPRSRYRGVLWDEGIGKWKVEHTIRNSAMFAGYYSNETAAAEGADDLIRRQNADEALLNFPKKGEKGSNAYFWCDSDTESEDDYAHFRHTCPCESDDSDAEDDDYSWHNLSSLKQRNRQQKIEIQTNREVNKYFSYRT